MSEKGFKLLFTIGCCTQSGTVSSPAFHEAGAHGARSSVDHAMADGLTLVGAEADDVLQRYDELMFHRVEVEQRDVELRWCQRDGAELLRGEGQHV